MAAELTVEEERLLAADDRSTARTGLWLTAIIGSFIGSLLIVACQAMLWLRYGAWPSFTLRHVVDLAGGGHRSTTEWVGAARLMQWLLACPLSTLLFVISLAATFLFTRHDNRPVPPALRAARMKRAAGSER